MSMLLLTAVVALYTITSLNDKYAISKCGISGNQLTFLMASGTAFFMLFALPFVDRYMTFSWQAILCIALIVVSKMLEFQMSAKILVTMSAFELKAWSGITLFLSYISDVLMGEELRVLRVVCIFLTAIGLVLIASAGKKKVNYKEIALPLILYIIGRFLYGIVMQFGADYISSTMTLFFALLVLVVILFPSAKPTTLFETCKEGKKGILIILLCKLPNVFGLLGENKLALTSLANWAFIMPMILVVMFIIDVITQKDGEKPPKSSLIGSVVCIVGVIFFQLCAI